MGRIFIWGYAEGYNFDLGVREYQKVENPCSTIYKIIVDVRQRLSHLSHREFLTPKERFKARFGRDRGERQRYREIEMHRNNEGER